MKASYKINYNLYFSLVVGILFLFFILNFFASPLVTPTYILLSVLIFTGVLLFDLKDSFAFVLIYCFIEGQGRILTGYHPIARIAFDFLMVLIIGYQILRTRRLVPLAILPRSIWLLLICHFIVFFLSLFNPKGVGAWISLPMIKVYIFPFFLFFMFVGIDFDFSSKAFKRVAYVLLSIIIMTGMLCIKQFQEGMPMMLRISRYYTEIGHLKYFTLYSFRPFGTTHSPGGSSTYLYLTVGLIFLAPVSRILLTVALGFSVVTMMLCQVRTAMIQYGLMIVAFFAIDFLRSTSKVRLLFQSALVTLLIPVIIYFSMDVVSSTKDKKQMDIITNRSLSIFDQGTIRDSRVGFGPMFENASKMLRDNPFGLGPGRSVPVTETMAREIAKDPVFDSNYIWNYDNLWYTLIIEFGYGAIFYILFILFMPIYLFSMALAVFRKKGFEGEFKPLIISSISVIIIVAANWGGIGIPYNPVSFMFWFWCATGFREYSKFKKTQTLLSTGPR